MHEMALAEGILAVVLDVADAQPVSHVYLQVGTLLRVVPESLRFAFQLITDGTPAAGAVLVLEDIPACWRCQRCGAESTLDMPPVSCHACQASTIALASGDGLMVDAIQLANGRTIRRRAVPADTILEEHWRAHEAHDRMPPTDAGHAPEAQ
jgi:hydrogenase nickel incorporation protein HypA/HybF